MSWDTLGTSISAEVENRRAKKKNRFWLLFLLLLLSSIGISLAIHQTHYSSRPDEKSIASTPLLDSIPLGDTLNASILGISPAITLEKIDNILGASTSFSQQTNIKEDFKTNSIPKLSIFQNQQSERPVAPNKLSSLSTQTVGLDSPKTILSTRSYQPRNWVPEARWLVEFAGGSNTFTHAFSNSEKQNFNEQLPGWQASVRLKKNLRNDLHLITGIQWTKLRFISRFQEEKEVNLYRPNTIDTIIHRIPSGNQEIIYRDSLPGIRSRNFQHYNSHQILSIPLLIGYERKLGGLKLGVQSGMQLNLLKQHIGKSLIKADEVWELGDGRIYRNRLGISYLLEAQLDWKIRPDNSIFLRASWDQNLDNWISEEISLKARPSILQISFGFSQEL